MAQGQDSTALVLRGKAHVYHVLTKLGAGGMATTYCAWEHKLGPRKKIAIKVMHRELAENDPATRESFEEEPRAMAGLRHHNIAEVLWTDELPDGTPLYALEFLNGESVSQVIRRGGRIAIYEAVSIAIDVLDGLHHAHKRGVVHQDVKAGNVMLHQEAGLGSVAKLIDFGVLRLNDDVQGGFAGTCTCAAPEQFRGEEVGPRADIFGVGGLLFHMLTGRRAFDEYGDGFKGAIARLDKHPAPISDVGRFPRELVWVVAHALDPRPSHRPESARYMADTLRKVLREIDKPRPVAAFISEVSKPITRAGLKEDAARTEPDGIDHDYFLSRALLEGRAVAQEVGHSATASEGVENSATASARESARVAPLAAPAPAPPLVAADAHDGDLTDRSPTPFGTAPMADAPPLPRPLLVSLPPAEVSLGPVSGQTNPRPPPISEPGDAAFRRAPQYVHIPSQSAIAQVTRGSQVPYPGPTASVPASALRHAAEAITAPRAIPPVATPAPNHASLRSLEHSRTPSRHELVGVPVTSSRPLSSPLGVRLRAWTARHPAVLYASALSCLFVIVVVLMVTIGSRVMFGVWWPWSQPVTPALAPATSPARGRS